MAIGFRFLKTGILALSGYIMCVCDAYIIRISHILISTGIFVCLCEQSCCTLSVGEGCVALRSAENSYYEFSIELTHHGEHTGLLTGGIQLPKSEGKQTEKLYGE